MSKFKNSLLSLVHFWTKFIQNECKLHDKNIYSMVETFESKSKIHLRYVTIERIFSIYRPKFEKRRTHFLSVCLRSLFFNWGHIKFPCIVFGATFSSTLDCCWIFVDFGRLDKCINGAFPRLGSR